MTAAIETLLFDFGGTLDADGLAWKERFNAHYRAEGLTLAPEAFDSTFFAADDPLVGAMPPDADLSETVHRLASNFETELGRRGDAAQCRADSDRGFRVASHFIAEVEAVFARNRPILEALNCRYRLGIVSNFYGNLEEVCDRAGLARLFGVIVDSHRVGAVKPDPAIFRAALDPLGAKAETTLLVGDSLRRDREGARRTGTGFVWVAPREVQVLETQRAGQPLDHFSVVRLSDLPEILA